MFLNKEIQSYKENMQPVSLRKGNLPKSDMTFEYRALVAELVNHGVSCAKIGPVMKACAKVYGVQLKGTSK